MSRATAPEHLSTHGPRETRRALAVLAAAALLAACPGAEPPADEPAAEPVESAAAGVRIAALPAVFEVESNDASGLALGAPSLPGPSDLTITLSDEYEQGLDIIDAVEQALAGFEARPAGRSFGQTQLISPLGHAYMPRGRYEIDGRPVEELRALLAHPWGNRLLTLSYVYPAGDDTSERGEQLMELLGEMEALAEPGGEPDTEPGGEPVE